MDTPELSRRIAEVVRNEDIRNQLTVVHNSLAVAEIGREALRGILAEESLQLEPLEGTLVSVPTHELFTPVGEDAYSRMRQGSDYIPWSITGEYDRIALFDQRMLVDVPASFKADPVSICLRLSRPNGKQKFGFIPLNSIDGEIRPVDTENAIYTTNW
jgi:hypothetical protein